MRDFVPVRRVEGGDCAVRVVTDVSARKLRLTHVTAAIHECAGMMQGDGEASDQFGCAGLQRDPELSVAPNALAAACLCQLGPRTRLHEANARTRGRCYVRMPASWQGH